MKRIVRKYFDWVFCCILGNSPKAFTQVTIKCAITPVFVVTAELPAPVILVALSNKGILAEFCTVLFREKIVIGVHIVNGTLPPVTVAVVNPFLPI